MYLYLDEPQDYLIAAQKLSLGQNLPSSCLPPLLRSLPSALRSFDRLFFLPSSIPSFLHSFLLNSFVPSLVPFFLRSSPLPPFFPPVLPLLVPSYFSSFIPTFDSFVAVFLSSLLYSASLSPSFRSFVLSFLAPSLNFFLLPPTLEHR